jgi:hypothetical protein
VQYNRTQLLVILLTPIIVVISSTALYFSGWLMPNESSNNGILLDPVLSVTDFGLPEVTISQDRQWRIIQFSPTCETACLEKVYEQRQMHIALGKLQPRITRVLLTGSNVAASLAADYPNLDIETFNAANLTNSVRARIPMTDLSDNPVFIVDPFGNIMLYFTSQHDYKSQMSDIKKLLKLSTIG